ncbi:hypothetical protein AA700_0559 [Acidiphilium acidophilum DSM 700]|nr:hypothetical protein AA700_0559 [Acidiphilium acidophilum DSM 700]
MTCSVSECVVVTVAGAPCGATMTGRVEVSSVVVVVRVGGLPEQPARLAPSTTIPAIAPNLIVLICMIDLPLRVETSVPTQLPELVVVVVVRLLLSIATGGGAVTWVRVLCETAA